ncbi:MAG TPA: glycosyltransferase family 1 protein, partial [Thiotrichales bacterium]|nr:glycosyltransferase family 1 protein [Thiotrichales bacterium]
CGITVVEPAQYDGFRRIKRFVDFLMQTCREHQVDIIHAHMADAAFLGWLVARKSGRPLVISHHGQDILLKCNRLCRFVYFLLLNLAARYAAVNIAVSAPVAERVRQLLFIAPEKVTVISNGVAIPEDAPNKRDNVKTTAPVLVTVGRLVPLKGHGQLIQAAAKLKAVMPGLKVYIVGGGDMLDTLQQLARQAGVSEMVTFTGAVNDVASYLAKADLFVSTSESEGMPVSVLEAMAWRLPVIASDIPGNNSVVTHKQTGFLYRLGDVDGLAETICTVFKEPSLAAAVAARARAMVVENYSAEAAEQAHRSLYRKIFAAASPV